MPEKTQETPRLIATLGPTATGKSDLAVAIARRFGCEIVSADSRQVYRGMDLGTGKITKREMHGVPHHLLDVASPKRTFTVAQYERLATRAISGILRRGKTPILCGGTGFYADAIISPSSLPPVPPDPALRARLAKSDVAKLFALLQRLDPIRARTIDAKNPHRLIRAIEIATALGSVPKQESKPAPYDIFAIGILPTKETLHERIHARLLCRLRQGMLAEAHRLHKEGLSLARMEHFGLEYRWMARHLSGMITKEEMISGLETDIRTYAKRQMTWFKRDKRILWVNTNELTGELSARIREFLFKNTHPRNMTLE